MSILSSKLFLISAGVVSLAVGFKFYVPFTVGEIPVILSVVLSWLKPPYLYVIINAIIVVIIVSSRFHWSPSDQSSSVRSEHLISVKTPPPSYYESLSAQPEIASVVQESMAAAAAVVYDSEDRVVEVKHVVVNGSKVVFETEEAVAEAKDALVDSMLTYDPPPHEMLVSPELPLEFLLPVREKPLLSSRFGHRKPIRTTPEGMGALKVAKQKRLETLDSTWKMITEGRHVPLTRHTQKSEASTSAPSGHVATSENFQDRTSYPPPRPPPPAAAERMRKEPSLGQDELNRRIEAFIDKINEEMRIQRQESLNKYKDVVHRGL
ncbi:uncharacterized protein LOC142523323 [Primulina tabacum]|uniref:uncharacterized protein LOC142523323 n=1 Tax=Primulina tabacum TaxID=48773 RepID=UPI003F599F9A